MSKIEKLISSINSQTASSVQIVFDGAVFTVSSGDKSALDLTMESALQKLDDSLCDYIRPAQPLDGDGLDRYIMERYHREQEKGRTTIPGQMSHTHYCEYGFDNREYWRLTYQSHIVRVNENGCDLVHMFAFVGDSQYQVYTVVNDLTIQLYMDEHVSGLDSWEHPGLKKKNVAPV